MKREILINGSQRETRVAILEDDRLVELLVDRPDHRRIVGDIYLGRVEAVLPGIQAAFVDIGLEKSAFLHASDLLEPEEDEEPGSEEGDDAFEEAEAAANGEAAEGGEEDGRRGRRGRRNGDGGGNEPRQREVRSRRQLPDISDLLKKGQTLLVQVTKEPISTKGCRVTAQISLAGRFLVYMPYASKVGVSRKIESKELRARLREMVSSMLSEDAGGMIVRTVAEDVTEDSFRREVESLLNIWRKINKKKTFVRAPALVQRETSLTRGIIRDLFSAKVDALHVDSKELFNEIENYLKGVDPELMSRVNLYAETVPLFDKFDIENEIRDLFKARCDLPTGGYIIIQPTEALVSIDVNTGRYTGKRDPEKTILKTNLEASREIARQIRLRDIGGIIVCDFIDMETRANRERVLQELRAHLGRDRARTKAFAVSELGLIEMTRQRVRPSLWHSMTSECPDCGGTGRVFTPEVVARRLERSLKRAGRERRERQMAIRLHPEVALYLLEEEPRLIHTLGKLTGLELELRDDPMMRVDEFRLMSRPAGRDVTDIYAVA
ncbi:MAG: Rne/Rng family ribonuclease [Gemmatimonadetes bacterium]|nr:Rne/Rng family ribonuclease [Gemmatimonadota bacterium]MBP9200972.1 Rne/Rng family ribonuclease [Gemmatimonadales bacterium]MBK6779104.1 Rne/Rng family ribonuclease [Gemmatimonadota bacterium]MBK7348585.1 Rne/Rng family ribonuclease [Gemmatimonadota bacterium]MBK7714150.1 Rne/Rng family ribonuclease [Gemmatimonadota bacterium]